MSDDSDERCPWPTATAMLGYYFAMSSHVTSIPAIDPSADVIQGLRVDRDERHWKIRSARQALEHLILTQGSNTGALLLWMHLRPSRVEEVHSKRKGWVLRQVHAVGIWELYEEIGGMSRQNAVEAYWEALRIVEDFAGARGWIAQRTERRSQPNAALL